MPPSKTFFGRAARAFSETHPGLAAGFLATFLTTFLMLIGATEGFEEYARSLVIQAQDSKPPRRQPIVIIRKDEETEALVNRNPARRELASVLRLLGRSRRVPFAGERSRLLKLVDLRLGHFPSSKKATLIVPWVGLTPSKKASAGIFFTFTENISRCADFMQFPFEVLASMSAAANASSPRHGVNSGNASQMQRSFPVNPEISSQAHLQTPSEIISRTSSQAPSEILSQASSQTSSQIPSQTLSHSSSQSLPQTLPETLSPFFENLRYMKLGFEIKLFPKEGTILTLAPTLAVELPVDYPVDAARIVSIDIILQGARLKEEDELLAAAIRDSETPIILAGQSQTNAHEHSQAQEMLKKTGQIASSTAEEEERFKIIRPYERFLQGNAMTGFVDARYSQSRFITALPLFQEVDRSGRLEPSFCLLTAVQALDRVDAGVGIPASIEGSHDEVPRNEAKNGDGSSLSVEPLQNSSSSTNLASASSQPGMFMQAMRRQLDQIADLRRKGLYKGGFQLLDRFIPTDTTGQMEVAFFGSVQKDSNGRSLLPAFSMSECFDDDGLAYLAKTLPEWADRFVPNIVRQNSMNPINNYGNRICLLGSFAQSDADFFETPMTLSTPFSTYNHQLSGVEINANAVLTILERRFIHPAIPLYSIALTLLVALLLGKSLEFAAVFRGGVLTLIAMAGTVRFAVFALQNYGMVMHLSLLLLTMGLTWIMSTLIHYWRQRRRAATTQAMFQKFVSADVVTAMIKNPDLVKPGGQKVTLTVFFSDLAGFSTISELLTAEKLVELLNEYLGTMTQLLFKHGGTLDKFIGDAVMAFWNFPVTQQDHAARACMCALAMQEKLNEMQVDWKRRGFPKVSARIGLNTAEVLVGYMGAEDAQMNFTCMGDGVNLASRLEGANKQYGTLIMASEATYLLARESVTGRFLDFLTVKGKNEPVKVYELISRKGAEPADWAEHSGTYEHGLELYTARNWTQAEEVFKQMLTRWPEDGVARTYLQRCLEFQATPPSADWDGVYHLTHK
ncbi:MAG: adenylate/guanylate cyclase domain-containing protein [Candidatus Ozemobacteraceae bacterium]